MLRWGSYEMLDFKNFPAIERPLENAEKLKMREKVVYLKTEKPVQSVHQ